LFFLLSATIGFGCTKDENVINATDYSDASHWLSNPSADKPVDVFYLYPTAWHKVDSLEPNICAVDHPMMLAGYLKKHPGVYDRMIAAYIIGYPVLQAFLDDNRHLKFAQGQDDTGVIISYYTQAPEVQSGANPVVADNIGLVINPISWTRTETAATAQQSLGSYLPAPDGSGFHKVLNYADARVDIARGVLICSSANAEALLPLTIQFGRGIYHSFDYPFYFYNIRQNAINRVEKYFGNGS
jgi:hypothetical protein